ncbi:hypothetical protein [Thiorhodovibrio frisius]|uniref:Uncharacterized protein n=1 Tax=Thiorhodovibrio frisius TaxID=631362 RepID=H8Z195_9GAMM|nr:hypothetical protein [Thiorhodovibrio frisius]EIC21410.1 hypothetical protein Thi970DRAFT_01617 [Thiorhodovibrio frisius]WPL23996.1 hypothetical protein Thiofri_04205 [Thiorhodovibrio frisius]
MKKTLFLFVALFGFSVAAVAEDYYVNITNNTGYTIEYLYVSPGNSDEWQDDVLGEENVLPNGSTGRVILTGYSGPIFDIRVEDNEGDTYTFPAFNVKEYDLVVGPDDID